MQDVHLGAVEARFADIIWANAPVSSSRLVELAREELDWKKSTTYTVLKRLCQRGLFQNEGGCVSAAMSREEYYARHSEQYVQENFGGSLPAFLAAFGSRNKLTESEIEELSRLIASMRG